VILTGTMGLGRIYMAQDRGKWRDVVCTVMNFHILNNVGLIS